ncbi:hypothetical protein Ancab_040311 [Ancistrocladus abbreviatus]
MIWCPWSWGIWCRLFSWWGVLAVLPNSIEAVVQQIVFGVGHFAGGAAWRTVCFTLVYLIWLARNQAFFEKKSPQQGLCFDKIRVLSFHWLKHKMGFETLSLHGWISDPLAEVFRYG